MNIIRKFNKRVLSICLTLMLLMVNVVPSFAEVITSEGMIKEVYGWDNVKKYPYMSSIKRDSSGNIVYCMNAEKPSPNGEDLPHGGYLDDVAYRILKYGYPNKSFTGDQNKDYVITQLAFWAYVDSKEVNINNLVVLVGKKEDKTLTQHVKDLYNKAINGNETQEINVEFSNKNMEAIPEGENFVTPYFRVNVTGESVSEGSFKIELNNEIEGIKYELKNGSYVNEIPMNTDFRLVIPKKVKEGNLSIRAIGKVTGNKVSWYKAPSDEYQNVAKVEKRQVQEFSKDNATITWRTIEGKVKVIKLDEETGEKLHGAEFELKNKSTGEVVENLVTGEDGTATSGLHSLGEYILKEIKAPNKYVLNGKEYAVTISEHMQTVEITANNRIKKGKIAVNKSDSEKEGLKLKGIEFEIRNQEGELVDKLVTDENGYAESKLLNYGKYTMKETKTLDSHVISDKVYNVEITEDGKVYTYDIKNRVKKGQVEVIKLDDSKLFDKPLEGAEFTIYDLNNEEVDKLVTDEKGHAISKDLEHNKYIMKETKAPNGYKISDKVYEINIEEDGQVIIFDISNDVEEGEVEFSKIDVTTGEIIDGAKIEITGKDEINNHIKIDFTSSKDGNKFKLPVGKYEFKEVQAPNGYVLNEEIGEFEIKEDGEIVKAEIKNKRIEGFADFKKIDKETKEIIEGAEIKIECLEGFDKGKVIDFTSSKDGNKIPLFFGKYTIKEIKAPNGYVKTDEIGEFEITEDGQIVSIELENEKMTIITENPKTGDLGIVGIATVTILALAVLLFINLKVKRSEI